MFTGIIGSVVEIQEVKKRDSALELILKNLFESVHVGESIAVNGVCLTVTQASKYLHFYVSQETCERSNLGTTKPGDLINLERALKVGDVLSGHLVQGHVDGTATLVQVQKVGDAHEITVKIPKNLSKFIVEKGSVTLNGISLTVNSIQDNIVKIMIIPRTWENTNLHRDKPQQGLNLEVDVIGKYVEKLFQK